MNYTPVFNRRLLIDLVSIVALLGLLYSCAREIPKALDKEESAYQAHVMARCVINGDYNMADAYCAAASKEKAQ